MTTVVIGNRERENVPAAVEKTAEVPCFSAPVRAKHLPIKAVLFVQLLLSAGITALAYFAPVELRSAIVGLFNG